MIPGDPDALKKAQELADRNIVRGDWGDEVTIPGVPTGMEPMGPDEREAKYSVARLLTKKSGLRVQKRK